MLLGVQAVIAESFERIHRSNLVGMGVSALPVHQRTERPEPGSGRARGPSISRTSRTPAGTPPVKVAATPDDGRAPIVFEVRVRIDTPKERDYYRHGIWQYVLRQLAGGGKAPSKAKAKPKSKAKSKAKKTVVARKPASKAAAAQTGLPARPWPNRRAGRASASLRHAARRRAAASNRSGPAWTTNTRHAGPIASSLFLRSRRYDHSSRYADRLRHRLRAAASPSPAGLHPRVARPVRFPAWPSRPGTAEGRADPLRDGRRVAGRGHRVDQPLRAAVAASGIFAEARECIDRHREAGDHLVLMSATVDLYVPQIAAALGFDDHLRSGVHWNGDRLDGRLVTANVRDDEKARLLQAQAARLPGRRIMAYGNSQPDLPHLRLAHEAVLANPGKRLREAAAGTKFPLQEVEITYCFKRYLI
jgi:phosphoserine phosphatase